MNRFTRYTATALGLWATILSTLCAAEQTKGFDVQLYVDTSASAIHWTSQDEIWKQSMVNFADRLKRYDRLKIYTVGKQLTAISEWIEKPSVDTFNQYIPYLFLSRASREWGTCTRDLLNKAASNININHSERQRNLLAIMIDEDEGAAGCPRLTENEWATWFEKVATTANVIVFPLNSDNHFATLLENASAAQVRNVAICRKNSEPNCHSDKLREWRKH